VHVWVGACDLVCMRDLICVWLSMCETLRYFLKKNSQYFSHVFVSFLHDLKKHWPRLLQGLFFPIKFFSRLRRDITFIITLFLTNQKNTSCISLNFNEIVTKKLSSIFVKKFSKFFTCFYVIFTWLEKTLAPAFAGAFPF